MRGSDKKLREMILYVLSERKRLAPRRRTDVRWLLNLLFLADLEAYRTLGRSISGKTYRRMAVGPVPSRFGHVMAAMQRDGSLEIRASAKRPNNMTTSESVVR